MPEQITKIQNTAQAIQLAKAGQLQKGRLYPLVVPPGLTDLRATTVLREEVGFVLTSSFTEPPANACFFVAGTRDEVELPEFQSLATEAGHLIETNIAHLHLEKINQPLYFFHSTRDLFSVVDLSIIYPKVVAAEGRTVATDFVISRPGILQVQLKRDNFRQIAADVSGSGSLSLKHLRKLPYQILAFKKGEMHGQQISFFKMPEPVPLFFPAQLINENQNLRLYDLILEGFLIRAFGNNWPDNLQSFYLNDIPSLLGPDFTEKVTFLTWGTAKRIFGNRSIFEIITRDSWPEKLYHYISGL